MTVADQIANWLSEKGITHAFGIVGGGNVALWDAIARLGKTQIICVHHEQAAAGASAFFNRIRQGIGSIALVTTGGGSANAITGVMAAYFDSSPLLVLSGNEASAHIEWGTRVRGVQGYDSSGLAGGFTKRGVRIKTPSTYREILGEALSTAMQPRRGPVWVDIPKDVQVAIV